MTLSRYVVGIDLGTTNSALAYFDTGVEGDTTLQNLTIPQVVQPGVVEERPLLPSFLYLPGPGEQPAGALRLPWAPERDFAVGEFARQFGSRGHDPPRPVSPLEASRLILTHLVEAWNHTIAKTDPAQRLELQDVVLTVPASFDA